MKNTLKYLKLWQKKRSEMHVDADRQADWAQMASLLDEKMPVAKTSSGFKRLKLLPSIFITFSAAAMLYVAGNIVSLEKHKHHHQNKHSVQRSNVSKINITSTDSLTVRDSVKAMGAGLSDSVPASNKPSAASDNNLVKAAANKSALNNSTTAFGAKTNAKGAVTGNNDGGLRAPNHHGPVAGAARPGTRAANNAVIVNKFVNGKTHSNGRGAIDHRLAARTDHHIQSYDPAKLSRDNAVIDTKGRNGRTGPNDGSQPQSNDPITATAPMFQFTRIGPVLPAALPSVTNNLRLTAAAHAQTAKNKNDKTAKPKNTTPSNIDWGILMGVNSSGSFTPKAQNANFYGSLPVDLYFGLFASIKINDTWALNPQVRLFSPQTTSTVYSHANQSKVDSGQSLTITASRKTYAVSVPIYVVYNVTDNISLKLGPVINFPVKQINANSLLQPSTIKADSTYYTNITGIINKTQYDQKVNFGLSAGASIKFNRFIFEATYLKSLSGYGINSGLGSYKSYSGTFQFTIGFQLDKVKPK